MNVKKRAGSIAAAAILLSLAGAPYLGREGAYEAPHAVTDPSGAAVDINSAPALELADLPGIGTELANAVVRYRQEHGPFESIEGIMDVPGIGEGKFAAIRDRIRAAAPAEGRGDGD